MQIFGIRFVLYFLWGCQYPSCIFSLLRSTLLHKRWSVDTLYAILSTRKHKIAIKFSRILTTKVKREEKIKRYAKTLVCGLWRNYRSENGVIHWWYCIFLVHFYNMVINKIFRTPFLISLSFETTYANLEAFKSRRIMYFDTLIWYSSLNFRPKKIV